jgi:predicted RNase H-like HicB family nuclease
MPGDRAAPTGIPVQPDGVTTAFAHHFTAMVREVFHQRLQSRHQDDPTPREASVEKADMTQEHRSPAYRLLPGVPGYAFAMATDLTWTAVFETVDEGWVQAHVAELPGVITTAPSLAEAKALLVDALREYLLSLRQDPPEPAGDSARQEPLHIVIDAA